MSLLATIIFSNRESLSVYQDLSLSDVEKKYWDAMKDFSIQ